MVSRHRTWTGTHHTQHRMTTQLRFKFNEDGERQWTHPTLGTATQYDGMQIGDAFRAAIEAHPQFQGWMQHRRRRTTTTEECSVCHKHFKSVEKHKARSKVCGAAREETATAVETASVRSSVDEEVSDLEIRMVLWMSDSEAPMTAKELASAVGAEVYDVMALLLRKSRLFTRAGRLGQAPTWSVCGEDV